MCAIIRKCLFSPTSSQIRRSQKSKPYAFRIGKPNYRSIMETLKTFQKGRSKLCSLGVSTKTKEGKRGR